jgi:hypothetical protein
MKNGGKKIKKKHWDRHDCIIKKKIMLNWYIKKNGSNDILAMKIIVKTKDLITKQKPKLKQNDKLLVNINSTKTGSLVY